MPAPSGIEKHDLADMLAGAEVFLDEATRLLADGPENRILALRHLRRAKRWMLARPDHEVLETLHSLFSDILELPDLPESIRKRIRRYYETRHINYRLASLERWRKHVGRERETDSLP